MTSYQDAVERLHTIEPAIPLSTPDSEWVENISRENREQSEKLEQELKRYKNNLLKESIRMGQADLGDFYLAIGELANATQSYIRQREYCTTHKHVKDLSLDLIRVAVFQQNWPQVESALARLEQLPNGLNELVPYVNAIRGIWALARGQFKSAASLLLDVKVETLVPPKKNASSATPGSSSNYTALTSSTRGSDLPSISEFLSTSDVAVIVGLCTLATYSRDALRDLLDNHAGLKELLESESHVRTLLESFVLFDYKAIFDTLEKHKNDYLLDIWLADHVSRLFAQIRENCYTQYVKGYKRGYISRMATRFGVNEQDIERDLVTLIESNKMSVRIDLENKIFVDTDSNERAMVYQQIMSVAKEYEQNAKLLLVNVEILRGGLEVNPPAHATAAGSNGEESGGKIDLHQPGRGPRGSKKKGASK